MIINRDKDITVAVDVSYRSSRMAESLKKNYNPKSSIHVLKGIKHMLKGFCCLLEIGS
ncbi:hypothetical protein [Sphingobacterium sp. 18053]|uniref:hypothetical protein n=1 Tax=Sphingobacterium sp. 18053 TaxID=2681401 RepID=UPI001F451E3C|nr:hypothetical protein [Sphingobacterium sp. 18053]